MRKWYVGVSKASRVVFASETTPTEERYSGEYGAVIGPFKTKRGALFCARQGGSNPHVQSVNDAERIAKRLAKGE